MKTDLISVIVPVYNVEPYLNRCIDSIVNQTYRNLEIILVDDGSPDNCPEMCDEWKRKDSRIKVIHQNNMGLSAARNTGIKNAKGKYIMFIDSDDWVSADMIKDLSYLINITDADIAMCAHLKVNRPTSISINKEKIQVYSQKDFLDIMLRIKCNRCVHYAWGKLYKKDVLWTDEHYPVGLLNEDVEGTFKAVLKSEKIVETNKIGYFYFNNEDSITRKRFGNNFLSLSEVWERIVTITRKEAPEYLEKAIYNQKRTNFTILCDMILYGDRETDQIYYRERETLLKCLRADLGYLMNSPMKFNRKIIMTMICISYKCTRYLFRSIRFCNSIIRFKERL